MGKAGQRSISTAWFRALGALGFAATASTVPLAYREDVPGWMRPWILAGVAWGALTSGFWLLTGKTLRMRFGEVFGDVAARREPADDTSFSSRAEALWWLATMVSFVLALPGAAGIIAAGGPDAWLVVPWGAAAVVNGFYRWWYWPAWTADESEGPTSRLLWRPGWQTASGWNAETWREAFELAGLPVSQVPKARVAFLTLLVAGAAAFVVAAGAANPEDHAGADALTRDLDARGSSGTASTSAASAYERALVSKRAAGRRS